MSPTSLGPRVVCPPHHTSRETTWQVRKTPNELHQLLRAELELHAELLKAERELLQLEQVHAAEMQQG